MTEMCCYPHTWTHSSPQTQQPGCPLAAVPLLETHLQATATQLAFHARVEDEVSHYYISTIRVRPQVPQAGHHTGGRHLRRTSIGSRACPGPSPRHPAG